MYGEPVTLLVAATKVDPYSREEVADWSKPPTEVPLETAWPPEPRPSSEPTQDARNAVVSGFTLYFADWPPIRPENRMRVRGREYEVLGEPAEWRYPSGEVAGSIVQVGRTEG